MNIWGGGHSYYAPTYDDFQFISALNKLFSPAVCKKFFLGFFIGRGF